MKRIIVVAGHYGSGKTELAVSLALSLAKQERNYPRLALVDLDVANPYFRSREQQKLLEEAGVRVYSDTFGGSMTAELPALTAALRAPLEDPGCQTIVDLGGNDAGARVLRQFGKYFEGEEHELWAVVNFCRYETGTLENARAHVEAIERELSLTAHCLVNNTHLLRETTPEIIRAGHKMAVELAEMMGKKLQYTCYPAGIVSPDAIEDIPSLQPLGLYMRPAYLDK